MLKYDKTPGWFKSDDFYFNKIILDNFDIIKKECEYLLENNLFVPHKQSRENIELDKLVLANQWNAFELGGLYNNQAKKHAPKTLELMLSFTEISNLNCGKIYFSMVPGNAEVIPHVSGLTINQRHRHQLCLISEEGSDAFIEVNNDRRIYQQGTIISFDDAYTHHVKNNNANKRIVLIYDSIGFNVDQINHNNS